VRCGQVWYDEVGFEYSLGVVRLGTLRLGMVWFEYYRVRFGGVSYGGLW